MTIKLLTELHLEFLNLKECCTSSSESTFVKTPHCWKSHVASHLTTSKRCVVSLFSIKVYTIKVLMCSLNTW